MEVRRTVCACFVGALGFASACSIPALDGDDESASEDGSTAATISFTAGARSTTSESASDSSGGEGADATTGEEEIEVWELRAHGFAPPEVETYYGCFSFSFPVDQLHHVVGFVPQVDNPLVHHYVLSVTDEPLEIEPGTVCFDWPAQIVWGWGPGGEALMLPDDAGFLAGHNGASANFVLQVHYNNPLRLTYADADGVDVLVTRNLRPNRAGVFSQGDIFAISIPPGEPAYEHVAPCFGELTSILLDEPINVFGVLLHAHELATGIRTEVWRDGALFDVLHEEDPYDFSGQSVDAVESRIEPGDTIETRCVYDSSERDEVTVGGAASDQEMCVAFMMYWPLVSGENCGSF